MPTFLGDLKSRLKAPWSKAIVVVAFFLSVMTGIGTIGNGLSTLRSWYGTPAYGSCRLRPETPVNIERLTEHFQDGLRYAAHGNADLATSQLQEVLRLDPNFLGAHINLGMVYLNENNLRDAQQAFEQELNLVDCLKTVPDRDLPKFAYMLHSTANPLWGGQRTVDYRARLKSAEDVVHYNLACLRLKQDDREGAFSELKLAARNCSIPEKTFESDSDLAPLRMNPAIFEAATRCPASAQ